MAFPLTPVLDAYNRADEGPPPSSNWTTNAFGFSLGQFSVQSNQMGGTAQFSQGYWSAQTFSFPCEVYGTLATWNFGSNQSDVVLVASGIGTSSWSGYGVKLRANEADIQVIRTDSGSSNVIMSTAIPGGVVNGCRLGLRVFSGKVEAWYAGSTGAWLRACTASDTTYTSGSIYLAAYSENASTRWDDYGGGNLDPTLRYVRRAIVT